MFEWLKTFLSESTYAQFVKEVEAYNNNEANKDNKLNLANLTEGKYVSKDKFSNLEATHNSKLEELNQANALIANLKKTSKGNEEAQAKITDYEKQVATLQEQLKDQQATFALQLKLRDEKALDVDYLAYQVNKKGKVELDENGNIKGWENTIKELKTQFPTQFDSGKKTYQTNPLPNDPNEPNDQPTNLADAIKASYEQKN